MIQKPPKRFGGALGEEFSKLWDAVVAGQVIPAPGQNVSRTSRGTIIEPKAKAGGGTAATSVTWATVAGSVLDTLQGYQAETGAPVGYIKCHPSTADSSGNASGSFDTSTTLWAVPYGDRTTTWAQYADGWYREDFVHYFDNEVIYLGELEHPFYDSTSGEKITHIDLNAGGKRNDIFSVRIEASVADAPSAFEFSIIHNQIGASGQSEVVYDNGDWAWFRSPYTTGITPAINGRYLCRLVYDNIGADSLFASASGYPFSSFTNSTDNPVPVFEILVEYA